MLDEVRLRYGLDQLSKKDRTVEQAIGTFGYPKPRLRPAGFATLANIIIAQQVSTKAAATVFKRIETALGGEVTPLGLISGGEATIRECGVSGRKAGYLLSLAHDTNDGRLDIAALADMAPEEAMASLVRLRGFGQWSAEIYLLFALGCEDIFPANDLALQIAYQRLKNLAERPNSKQLRHMTLSWSPYRGAAALFLWHLYGFDDTFKLIRILRATLLSFSNVPRVCSLWATAASARYLAKINTKIFAP